MRNRNNIFQHGVHCLQDGYHYRHILNLSAEMGIFTTHS